MTFHRRPRFATVVYAACVGFAAPAQDRYARYLEHSLAIEDPKVRRAGADALAAREDSSVEVWLERLRAWRPEPALEPGDHRIEVDLWNGQETERTEVFVYVPDPLPDQDLAPLMHTAHGTGGDGRGVCAMWREVADALGMVVIAPSESGANEGYRFADREREIARAAIRWAKRSFPIDASRVYLSGISRGGHLTWDLALRWPDLAAAIAPMIGGPRWNPNGQNNLRFLEHIAHLPIRDLQGLRDDARMIANLRMAFEDLQKFGAQDARFVTFEERGHSFDFDAVDWKEFLSARRAATPKRVLRVASTPGQGRAFWAEVSDTDAAKVRDAFRPAMPQSVLRRLDDAGQRRWIADRAVKLSARLELRRSGPAEFRATTRHVQQLTLRLTDAMLGGAKKVVLHHRGRCRSFTAERTAKTLLRDFVDRLDRDALYVSEVRVDLR